MKNTHYDCIIIGAGVAGLSLAWNLLRSRYQFSSLLLIDRRHPEDIPDRHLSFWHGGPLPFEPVIRHSWNRISVHGTGLSKAGPIAPYTFSLLNQRELTSFLLEEVRRDPRVTFRQEPAQVRQDRVETADSSFTAKWIFDGTFPKELPPETVYMSTAAVHATSSEHMFAPENATLFDFRGLEKAGLFTYVLPLSPCEAIVESVYLAPDGGDYGELCRETLVQKLEGRSCTVTGEQFGVIPLLMNRKRKSGSNVLRIGLNGGMVKPSTGYGLMRIWRDSQNIARSLEKSGHPFELPPDPALSRWCDGLLLNAFRRNPDVLETVFTRLFATYRFPQVLSFLDGTPPSAILLSVMARVTPWPFLKTWFRTS